ncbi:MAG TPA: hypothetical protein VGQ57_06360, partial [Polyangiaceae bacterium]|nr:hypothetical protein [Polyangiaceae bacterium]
MKLTETQGKKKVDRWVWQLSVVWKVEADLYRRSPQGFEYRATVQGDNGGLFGSAMALSALAPQKNGVASALPLSKRPQPGCNPPLLPELSHLAESTLDCKDALVGLGKMAEHVLEADATASAEATASTDPAVSDTASAAEGSAEAGAQREGEKAADKLGAGEARDAVERAGKATEKVPGVEQALGGAAADAAQASGASDAVKAAESAISAEERSVLQALAGADPSAVDRLVSLEATVKSSAVLKLIGRAKHAFDACKKGVTAVQDVSEKLRTLSQQGPQSLGIQAVAGLASCAGIDLAPDLSTATAPGSEQRSSKFCENVKNDAALGEVAMKAVAVCDGRVAMEHATLSLQKDVKRLRGIKLFGTLLDLPGLSPNVYGIALGTEEGVHRGDVYVAVSVRPDGSSVEGGFGRVLLEGPGGPGAVGKPSQFMFRNGTADVGTRVEEHAQVGVPLGVRPMVKYYTFKGQLKTSVAYGAAIEGGYNASRYVPVAHEVWGRACVSVAAGSDKEMFFDAELGPEVVHYLGGGFAAYGGLGVDLQYATKDVATTPGKK